MDILGDQDAAILIVLVGDLCRLADDLADGDSADPQADVAELLILALHEIPSSPFFLRHADLLRHALAKMMATWDVSNRFHRTDSPRKHVVGFVLREADDMFLMQVAGLCLGWQEAASAYERLFAAAYASDAETVADWVGEKV